MVENKNVNGKVSNSSESQELMATNIAVRADIDGILEIMGQKACQIMYRNAGLLDVFNNPPEYNFDPCIPRSQRKKIYTEIFSLVGLKGAVGIFRRIGYTAMKYTDEIGHVADPYKDLQPDEKYLKIVELFQLALGLGRVVSNEDGSVDFDFPECIQCEGYKFKRPICLMTAGCLQYIADKAFGKDIYWAKETKCKAMGDETCYYVLEKRE